MRRDFLRSALAAAGIVLALLAVPPRTASGAPPPFDGQRAWDLVKKQCDFGPRNPGSAGHQACLAFLEAELRKTGASVRRQPFSYTPPGGKRLDMANLIASFDAANPRRVLLSTHWDTRPWADMDPDTTKRNEPILGANDGASGVAVLLELAKTLGKEKADYGVDLVFFDGEDLGTPKNKEGFFRGSREFGRTYAGPKPVHSLLLDMVGDSDLLFYMEALSTRYAPQTIEWIWDAGHEVAPAYFADQVGYAVEDDHMALNNFHIPSADLIDFDYPYWHTLKDTPDKVSPASLQVVGEVLLHVLYPH